MAKLFIRRVTITTCIMQNNNHMTTRPTTQPTAQRHLLSLSPTHQVPVFCLSSPCCKGPNKEKIRTK